VKAGDVITSINGKAVSNSAELRNTIGLLRIGEKVDLALIREGKQQRVTAVIGERNTATGDTAALIHPALEGASLTNADNGGGVLIQAVAEGSPAAQSGLRPNDVILGIGRTRIANLDQLRAAIKGSGAFAITIRRGNSTQVFPIG
jgi:S1-C subfamily serine protease